MKKKLLTNKAGEVRELTREDIHAMLPGDPTKAYKESAMTEDIVGAVLSPELEAVN